MAFNFERLEVWKLSVNNSGSIYDLTKGFPKEEIYGLTSQIRRASDSVSLNIAEGSTGQTKVEFGRFLGYAVRSGIEVIGCLYLARTKGFIDENVFSLFYQQVETMIIKIQSLRKSLR
ncbi:four helix bundle protein [Pseudochryseolinea flava]|uniref:Four helix bundle protein n=1 Tax=Pseudochryseolinea flava TaxID=2059302 RepID=A0A364Y4L1_9BACT|nr:four helix bundle protein [Pseudochryseolinea flava]RAW01689.1 four helix bundle protein [Pseudochryseolinea flava]